jgi:hypothetical protein
MTNRPSSRIKVAYSLGRNRIARRHAVWVDGRWSLGCGVQVRTAYPESDFDPSDPLSCQRCAKFVRTHLHQSSDVEA